MPSGKSSKNFPTPHIKIIGVERYIDLCTTLMKYESDGNITGHRTDWKPMKIISL
jgi:hypothetical protein